jgi:hypothetical protein
MSEIRRSATDLLRTLPDVFDLSTLSRMADMEREAAYVYLTRWSRKGLVQPAGQRAGIYFNLVTAPDAPRRLATTALVMEYPTAILRGASVLHAAGWTTQIPQETTVAVLQRRTYAKLSGFDLTPRPRAWYTAVHGRLSTDPDLCAFGLRSLTPALALADAYAPRGGWKPDPDDLDLDDADPSEIVEAFATLGVELPDFLADTLPTP